VDRREEKLYEKIKNNPKAVEFDELDKLLRRFGFDCRPPKGGSHYVYSYRDYTLTISRPHGHRKHIAIEQVKRALRFIDEIREEGEQ